MSTSTVIYSEGDKRMVTRRARRKCRRALRWIKMLLGWTLLVLVFISIIGFAASLEGVSSRGKESWDRSQLFNK